MENLEKHARAINSLMICPDLLIFFPSPISQVNKVRSPQPCMCLSQLYPFPVAQVFKKSSCRRYHAIMIEAFKYKSQGDSSIKDYSRARPANAFYPLENDSRTGMSRLSWFTINAIRLAGFSSTAGTVDFPSAPG